MTCIEEALGSTVARPSDKVIIEKWEGSLLVTRIKAPLWLNLVLCPFIKMDTVQARMSNPKE
uniref:Uncharacterized protein n=1 Tax=Cucumis melo TaxID=3656 RepID=A0A9I9EAY8_CUCME